MKKHEKETRKIYAGIAGKYHRIIPSHFYNAYLEVPATMSLLKNVKGKKVLDLGCGTGIYTKILKKRGARVWGLDLSPEMIEIAKSEIKDVDFRVGTVYKLPYRSGFFDMVVASLVIHYFKDLDRAFREVRRVLKRKGLFIFSSSNPLWEVSESIKGRPKNYRVFGDYFREGRIKKRWSTFRLKMPVYHVTLQTLIRTIVKNGFVLEDLVEARAIKTGRKIDPASYKAYSRIPYFYVFKVRKI